MPTPIESVGSPVLWIGFLTFVIGMLALDLGVFHRKSHAVGVREALAWSAFWIGLALVFNLGVFFWFGPRPGMEFLTGYLLEKALSVDNLFVFIAIFSYFAVPAALQHRVLFWGIIGALVLRAVFILLGGAILQQFHWAIYVFGGILAITGLKMMFGGNEEIEPGRNPAVRFVRRLFPVVTRFEGSHFFVKEGGRRFATPLLLALVALEASDIVFAVDSVPAVLAVTSDPFIVFTSNIFAILGLRSLYFVLAGVMAKFAYLRHGLALILVLIGAKMLLTDVVKVPIGWSLGAIVAILGTSIAASLLRLRLEARSRLGREALPPEGR